MKTLLSLFLVCLAMSVRGAVPTIASFEPTQFDTNDVRIKYKSDWTNEVTVLHPATVNDLVTLTNFNAYGTVSVPSKVTLLSLGTNELDMTLQSSWLLNSPTNDASQVILSLSAGSYQGQIAWLVSQNDAGGFTLPNNSEQYDVPGALVIIGSDWIGTTNRGIHLMYSAPDWILLGLPTDPSVPGGGGVSGTVNTLAMFGPTSTSITNSPAYLDGVYLAYTNNSASPGIKVFGSGGSVPAIVGLTPGAVGVAAQLSGPTGVAFGWNTGIAQFANTNFIPSVPINLGTPTFRFGNLQLASYASFSGTTNRLTDDGSQLLYNGSPIGGGTTINPTDGFLPIRTSATTFGDSQWQQSAITNLVVDIRGTLPTFTINPHSGQVQITRPSGFNQAGLSITSDATADTLELAPAQMSFDGPAANFDFYLLDTNKNWRIMYVSSPTPLFQVNGVSGYTGAGTLFLSDDGTYKSAGGSALWSSSGGVLTPDPAVDAVSVPSRLEIGVTNSVYWGGDAAFVSIGFPTIDLSSFSVGNAFLFGIGDTVFDSTTFTNCSEIYGLGNYTAESSIFDGSHDIYAMGNSELSGVTFEASRYILSLGMGNFFHGALTNMQHVGFIGDSGSNLTGKDSSYLYSFGSENFNNAQITNATANVFAFGKSVLGQSIMNSVGDVVGIGTSVLNQMSAFGSSAIYGIGNTSLQLSTIQNASDFYAYGDGVMGGMIATNTIQVHGLGDSVLNNSRLTNSSAIYAFGYHTGEGLAATGLTDVMLFGSSTQPTQSHQMTWNVDSVGSGDIYRWQNGLTNKFTVDYAGIGTFSSGLVVGATNVIGALAGKQNLTVGTVVNSGTPVLGQVPFYSDTTGTNVAPSGAFTLSASTNAALKGNLTANGITSTNQFYGPNGSTAAPTFSFTSATNTGMYISGGQTAFTQSGSLVGYWSSGSIWVVQNGGLDLLGTPIIRMGSSADLILNRDGAARLQLGLDAASPVNQVIGAADGSGTDKAGADLKLSDGRGTGTGRGGALYGTTSLTTTTGSTVQSESTRFYHSAKFVDLTESTATLFANIPLASSKYMGVRLNCTVNANDGTDFQAVNSNVSFAAVNKAGTVTVGAVTQNDDATAPSAGTLTVTYTAVANGAGVDIKANAVSSLTQTTLRVKWSILSLNSDDTAVVAPQ